ncbi:MAG: ATP-dependent RNA helicase HrpA [Pirellulales bacterium]|nr:ATP-dependent RNA helicase HrpA [Pirellulales bacterium]
MSYNQRLESQIGKAMKADRHRLRRLLEGVRRAEAAGKPFDRNLARLNEELERSIAIRTARREGVPKIGYDEDLPVCAKRHEIAAAIREHAVVIVCGETGSGKSTQLPKICLELGRGIEGMIGHTQPRRIAARSVAARIADELHSPLGKDVGFKIRFADSTSPQTYIKVMTDGILLAESQGDPYLNQYDTILLDEAHERSLNIDFLIGYLKRLLPKRRDLKLIITSATLDAARFAAHFASDGVPAPILEVSGRTYPVEVRYRPLVADEESGEPDWEASVLDAVDELARIDTGDILIFMPTERDIHETAKALRSHVIPRDSASRRTEILPLYARLSTKDQQRVFQPHTHRRIVIATNVAESSLTVPGIRYVVDPGTARISRYSPRTKTQRLPIEAISQASADQRMGRCGRVAQGVCIRLYREDDYQVRDRYTAPEIQRTNLASVILQTKALQLGPIEDFPFLDPPRADAIRDGYKTLFELGAIDENDELTEIGRQLSRLPADPRIGRIILAGHAEGCLSEVLIIAAALEVQDPRERPLEKQQLADEVHGQFADPASDFLGYLKLWDFYHHLKGTLSRNQLRKACRQNFLSYNRMREWTDIHLQLLQLVEQAGLQPGKRRDDFGAIHRAVLSGLLSNLGFRTDSGEYAVAGGGKAQLWPGSAVFKARPTWVVAAEVVETTRRYLRTCARIDPRWIESIAGHLIKRSYSDPHWQRATASAMAVERVTLFGLTVVPGRKVRYGPIKPDVARALLIQNGLVEGDFDCQAEFFVHNHLLREEMEQLQRKLRRHDFLLGQWAEYDFYDLRIPHDVVDGAGFNRWRRKAERNKRKLLFMSRSDLVREELLKAADGDYPDAIQVERMKFPVEYRFEPGSDEDGVTLNVPLEALNQIDPARLGWLVPGLLEQKVVALIKALPKQVRRQFVPAPDTAKRVLDQIEFGRGDITGAVAAALGRLAGQPISPSLFELDKVPSDLRMNLRVIGVNGQPVATGRDLEEIRRRLGAEAASVFSSLDDPKWNRDGLTTWDFEELPAEIDIRRAGLALKAYPMLVDQQTSVGLRLADSPQRAERQTWQALRRLLVLGCGRQIHSQAQWLPRLEQMRLHAASIRNFDLKSELVELIADRAARSSGAIPRSRGEFDRFVDEACRRIGLATQDVAELSKPLFEEYHQARLAHEEIPGSKWQYAAEDVRLQLQELVASGFLTSTPWIWLFHYPRYFRAITYRLQALRSGSLSRDREGTEEIRRWWNAYLDRLQQHRNLGIDDPQLVQFRWMLEEYRVSLFAQKLGTAMTVSSKRLAQQWESVPM